MGISVLAQLDPLYAVWWVVSLALSALFGILLFQAQHTFNPGYVVEKAHQWKQSEAAFKGSSLLWIPPLLRWFTMGIEYHHIHHFCSRVPGYKLQVCHQSASKELMSGVTRLGPRALWKSWQYVLYDEDKHAYVTFGDLTQKRL